MTDCGILKLWWPQGTKQKKAENTRLKVMKKKTKMSSTTIKKRGKMKQKENRKNCKKNKNSFKSSRKHKLKKLKSYSVHCYTYFPSDWPSFFSMAVYWSWVRSDGCIKGSSANVKGGVMVWTLLWPIHAWKWCLMLPLSSGKMPAPSGQAEPGHSAHSGSQLASPFEHKSLINVDLTNWTQPHIIRLPSQVSTVGTRHATSSQWWLI